MARFITWVCNETEALDSTGVASTVLSLFLFSERCCSSLAFCDVVCLLSASVVVFCLGSLRLQRPSVSCFTKLKPFSFRLDIVGDEVSPLFLLPNRCLRVNNGLSVKLVMTSIRRFGKASLVFAGFCWMLWLSLSLDGSLRRAVLLLLLVVVVGSSTSARIISSTVEVEFFDITVQRLNSSLLVDG